jgi:peptide deformylase
MARRSILIAPDARLRQSSAPVERVDKDVRLLMDDLVATMRAAPGIGLAAPQIGVRQRVMVVEVPDRGPDGGKGEHTLLRLANPEILWVPKEMETHEEGCLSLPEQYANITRPAEVKVRYLDPKNEICEIHASGLLATCLQHEIEHLDGILFIDHLSSIRRNIILRKLAKMKRNEAAATG